MSATRKVYVATTLDQNKINEAFQWPDGFERTLNRDEAEFIVFDASNVPKKYSNYIADKPTFYVPNPNVPVLFVALGEFSPDFERVKEHFDPVEVPVCKTTTELFNALKWFESIMPFYNKEKTPNIDKTATDLILSMLKANPGR